MIHTNEKKCQKQVNNKGQVFSATLTLFRFEEEREWFDLLAWFLKL